MKKPYFFGILILSIACNGVTSTPDPTTQTPAQPATATLTPTPTSTARETLTPTPVPLYFTEEFNTDLGAWTFQQTEGELTPSTTLENDSLRVDFSSPDTWLFGIHNSHTYSDVSVSTKFTGTPSGSMGLICRYGESGWYEFNIGSDGTYGVLVGHLLSDGIVQYIPIATGTTPYLQPGNLSYEIKLSCQENDLLLNINGKLFRKMDVAHYDLPEGKVGITVSSFEETPATIFFEWVQITSE